MSIKIRQLIHPALICLFAFLFIGLSSQDAAAAEQKLLPSCQPIYGGGENCLPTKNIEINKTVQNPKSQDPKSIQFVKNLGQSDPKYLPDQKIQFKISIKNTSGNKIDNITIKDKLPRYIECDSSECDKSSRIITINISSLNKDEIRTIFIKGKIVGKDKLQNEPKIICPINQAKATQDKQATQDNAQFCIQNDPEPSIAQPISSTTKGGKQVFPSSTTNTTPQTGPETLALASLIPLAGAGFWLRRKY